jgi:hypothetical protein
MDTNIERDTTQTAYMKFLRAVTACATDKIKKK